MSTSAIPVAQWSYDRLLDEADRKGLNVEEVRLTKGYLGAYFDDFRLILIDSQIRDYQKKCALTHEIIHANRHDKICSMGDSDLKAEKIVRRLTAVSLINLSDYRHTEELYGPDLTAIACELDVTEQVVEDYQQWLKPRIYRFESSGERLYV